MTIQCPKCGQECEGEAPNKPWFYVFECDNCGLVFDYDDYRNTFHYESGVEICSIEEVRHGHKHVTSA